MSRTITQVYAVVEWSVIARGLFAAYWIAAFVGIPVDHKRASKHVMRHVNVRCAKAPDLIP